MPRGVRFYLGASVVLLLALAGCGRMMWNTGERPNWRHEAEVNCLKSGDVKLGADVVQIEPIEGPGMCGADFPLKVSALGDANAVPLAYGDDMRPPASIPGSANMPNWPVRDPNYAPVQRAPIQPVQTAPMQAAAPSYDVHPVAGETMRWTPGPQGVEIQQTGTPMHYAPAEQPVQSPAGRPMSLDAPDAAPRADDIPDDAILPNERARTQPAYNAPNYQPPQRALPPLGPQRGPATPVAMAALQPAATLSCPIVSALDRWVSQGVQPAAMHWFGSQVVSIKQIGSYSCREMVGAGGDYISEHAFGDALDIAGFTLADGRTITVKDGWHGKPEEQGFLHDVQLYACETFSTVLAPGYNIYHYDHIHVDLMRRASGRRPCRPDAIPGEVAAAKARAVYAARHNPAYTGSITAAATGTAAIPGADGYLPETEANREQKPVEQPVYLGRAPKFPGEDRMTRVY